MKVLTSIMAMFILSGCSTEEIQPATVTDTFENYNHSAKKYYSPKNSYAYTGAVYQEMLDTYYLLPDTAEDIAEFIGQIETIAALNPGFASLNSNSVYRPLSPAEVAPYLNGGSLTDLLSHEYSVHAATVLLYVASELDDMKALDLPYRDVEAFFKTTDSAITNDSLLSDGEKDALLTTTAIVCNALDNDRKRKRRDRDWEWMTTHLAATANAALESTPQAIMMSFATDVYHD